MRNLKLKIAREALLKNHHPEVFLSVLLDQEILMEDRVYLSPYDLGFDMYYKKYGRFDNPFDSGTGDFDRWDQGWCEALEEETALALIEEEEMEFSLWRNGMYV